MNIFYHRERIKHFLKRKNEYSLHSPFMFNLYLKEIKPIKHHRKRAFSIAQKIQQGCGKENTILIERPYLSPESKAKMEKQVEKAKAVAIDLFHVVIIIHNNKLSSQIYYF